MSETDAPRVTRPGHYDGDVCEIADFDRHFEPGGVLIAPLQQGEPSDAQVRAALNAWGDDRTATLDDWHPEKVQAMRAALRAAMATS